MKKAIITGATGLVGMAVAKYFAKCGVETLCIGKRNLSFKELDKYFDANVNYLSLSMENLSMLAEKIDLIDWSPGDECVFFNFAWRGYSKLTDGSFSDQIRNAIHASEAVRIAKNLGCIKFVNAGSLEETNIERFFTNSNNVNINSSQPDYALAKLLSRDMCTMVAYLEKIDYVHTRMSVPLSSDLSGGTYVAESLRKIYRRLPIEEPLNMQKFDITLLDDIARAYYLIGFKGKNKANYYIGTSKVATLAQHFKNFDKICKNKNNEVENFTFDFENEIFNTLDIQKDTGFTALLSMQDIIKK